ncbi:MAG: hypothetical protein J2O48_09335 [Solirubrobacterales bacterium]|nr:hypothetical protein [Solirubrobacterales bacterium]
MSTQHLTDEPRFRVLIAGGGVAALEAALALADRGGEHVQTTLLAPNSEFVYRPLAVREPFGGGHAARFPLAQLAHAAGATHVQRHLEWVDHFKRLVHTRGGPPISYDALLLALGTRMYSQYRHATTLDPARLDQQLHGLIQDVEAGYVKRIAFVVPLGFSWPLPVYELALMTATRGASMGMAPQITILTPEAEPLEVFGTPASDAVARLLARHGVKQIGGGVPQVPAARRVRINGGPGELYVDRVFALPSLHGHAVPGIPSTVSHGFITTTPQGQVRAISGVFAAGDITSYPVKQGGIAAQQAAAVAVELAGLAGASTRAAPFQPILRGALLSGSEPLYMQARLIGGRPADSQVSREPLWEPAEKIDAPYLSAALASLYDGRVSVPTLAPTR